MHRNQGDSTYTMQGKNSAFFCEVENHCICPDCAGSLGIGENCFICTGCGRQYSEEKGVVQLLGFSYGTQKNVQQLSGLYDKACAKYEGSPKSCGYATDKSFRHRLNILNRWIDTAGTKNWKILDVGCGTGLMTQDLARQNDVWGVDISAGLLQVARKKGIKIIQGSAEFLPFKANLFDLVVCMGVLPYYTDPENIFSHIARVTKPTGKIVITSTTDSVLIKWVRRIKNMFWKKSQLKRLYAPRDLQMYMKEQNLDVQDACLGFNDQIVSWPVSSCPLKFQFLARVAAVYGTKADRI